MFKGVRRGVNTAQMTGLVLLLALMMAMISARTFKYRYPAGQVRELARSGIRPDHYPARIPGYQHPLEMASPRPTPVLERGESWDATETVWVTSVDPQLLRTVTVLTTATMAKLMDFSGDSME